MINNPNAPVRVKSTNNKLSSAKLQRKRSGASKRKEIRDDEEVWAPSTHRSRREVFDLAQETRDVAEDATQTSSITRETTDNSVTFAMFLGDVKGYFFDKNDKTITAKPTESAESETAENVSCELLTSAKEIGTITKDVVVEETMGCAAWSFAAFLPVAGLDNATGVKEPVKAETNDQPFVVPVAVEGLSLLAEQILADVTAVKGPPTEAGDSISMLTDDNLPNQSTGPKSYDDRSSPFPPSYGMSTMSITEKSNADMKEHLRQIKDVNAEMERILERGDPADVDLAKVLKHRSKLLCKTAVRTSKVIGKSSKKGLGSALLSTSKAMGSLGEKLAKSKRDDVTHTTVENSTLSSRGGSDSRDSSRPTSSCSRSQSRCRSVQSNISATKGLKKTRRPMITRTTGDESTRSSRSRSRSRPSSSCRHSRSRSRGRRVQSNISATNGLKKTRRPMITRTTGDQSTRSSRSRSRSRPTSSYSRSRSRPNPLNKFQQQEKSKFTDEMFSALSVAAVSRQKSLLN